VAGTLNQHPFRIFIQRMLIYYAPAHNNAIAGYKKNPWKSRKISTFYHGVFTIDYNWEITSFNRLRKKSPGSVAKMRLVGNAGKSFDPTCAKGTVP
jgi:hypothetical protein